MQASTLPEYSFLVDEAVVYAKKSELLTKKEKMELAIDKVATAFGCEILKLVPGLVSTEVDARLSFNKDETVKRAKRIISLYKEAGVDKSRVLIKVFIQLKYPTKYKYINAYRSPAHTRVSKQLLS
jgi:transaldolase